MGDAPPVLVAGGGIAGLSLALTLHQVGIDVRVYESVREVRPLGVGINLQPNAVRELLDLGLADALPGIGVATEEYGFYTKTGKEIWTEPRGLLAGYAWPQYSIHRGELQMLLYRTARERLGPDRVITGARAVGYENHNDHVTLTVETTDGLEDVTGSLLIGADGLHSAIRAQMWPDEGPPLWSGAVLWRGTTRGTPFRTGASMALIGNATQRFVTYPISHRGPDGTALMNWIAELAFDPASGWNREDWNRRADKADFFESFADWRFDWIDCAALIEATDEVFEYPMVDRDPLDRWTDGRTTLMGDAAHIMYPVGSNGASQAIVDARKIGRAFLDHGVAPDALLAYEDEMRPATSRMVLAARGAGPDAILQIVEDRCGGEFDDIDDVMAHQERSDFAANFKKTAGFSIDALNAAPPIIGPGAMSAPATPSGANPYNSGP